MALAETPEKKAAVNAALQRSPRLANKNSGRANTPRRRVQPLASITWATASPKPIKTHSRKRGIRSCAHRVPGVMASIQIRPAAAIRADRARDTASFKYFGRPLFIALCLFGQNQGPVIRAGGFKLTDIRNNTLFWQPAGEESDTAVFPAVFRQRIRNI